jgi:DNA-binding beta-propeller fold protein YncE
MTATRREFLAAAVVVPVLGRGVAFAGASALALVTADTQAQIVVVSLPDGRVLRRIPTPRDPRAVETVGGRAVVAHTVIGELSLVDREARSVTEITGPMREPRYMAADRSGDLTFVSDSGLGEVLTVDLDARRVVGRVDVGGPARHIGIDPTGRRIWTSLGGKAERIAVLDVSRPRRPRLVRTLTPPFRAHDVAFSPSGEWVWVTSGTERRMAIYRADGRLVRTLDADLAPQHVAFGRRVAYVTSGDSGTLRVHRLPDGEHLTSRRIPIGSYNVASRSGTVITPSLSGGSLVIADRNGRPVRTMDVARNAHDACVLA